MLKVGDVVSAHGGRLKGTIIGVQGDAEGRQQFRVVSFSLLPQSGLYSEHELQPESPPKTFEVGDSVTAHGQRGELIDVNPDGSFVFRAEIVLPSQRSVGKVVARHVYPTVTADQLLRWNL